MIAWNTDFIVPRVKNVCPKIVANAVNTLNTRWFKDQYISK